MVRLYGSRHVAYSETSASSCCAFGNVRDLDGLRQFLELARTLHFSRAAAALHVSLSTLSRAMQRLERELGVELFDRQHHRVELTAAGDALRRHASTLLEDWAAFEEQLRARPGALRGVLHVYCTVTATQTIVPALLGQFRESHPDVRLELVTGYAADALDQLRSGSIDASIAPLPPHVPAAITAKPLATTPVVLVAPTTPGPVARLVDRARPPWRDVPFVLPVTGLVRVAVDAWAARRGLDLILYGEVQGHEAILSLVALGCGVGAVPALVVESSALRDRLRVLDVAIDDLEIALCVRRRSLGNPVVAALWEAAG
jgi:LysR family transcriptional regulator, positive regulator for ilvC